MRMLSALAKAALMAGAGVLLTGAFHMPPRQRRVPAPREKPIVVLVETTQGRVTYKVQSRPVHTEDMLRAFGELLDQGNREQTVLVLMDADCPVSTIWFIEGVAGKAGFRNYREFVFRHDRYSMYEIKFGKQTPFSTSPPLD